MWSRENKLPVDFLDYPAYLVREVMHLQSIEEEVAESIQSADKRMEEWQKKASGRG